MGKIDGGVAPYMMGLVLGVAVVSTVSGNQARQQNIDNQTKYIEQKKHYLQEMAGSVSKSYALEQGSSSSTGQAVKANHQVYTNIFDLSNDLQVKEGSQASGSKTNIISLEKNENKIRRSLGLSNSGALKEDFSNDMSIVVDEAGSRKQQVALSYNNMKKQAAEVYNEVIKSSEFSFGCSVINKETDAWGRNFNFTRVDSANATLSFNLPWNTSKEKHLKLKLPQLLAASDSLKVKNIIIYRLSAYLLLSNGDLYVAGNNTDSELGIPDGATNKKIYPWVKTATDVKDIHASYEYAAILKNNGEVWTTGYNYSGTIVSNNDTVYRHETWTKTDIENVKQIYTFQTSIYALKENNELFAAGQNSRYRRLGIESGDDNVRQWSKVKIDNVKKIRYTRNSANQQRVMHIITNDNKLWVTGRDDYYGTLGLGDVTSAESNVIDTGITDVKDVISDGGRRNVYVITNSGDLYVAGENTKYQLGIGTNTMQKTWMKVPGITGVKSVVAPFGAVYAITTNGDVWVAGDNSGDVWFSANSSEDGRLGVGGLNEKISRFTKTPLKNIKDVVAAYRGAYAITTTGDVWGVGNNEYLSLGIGSEIPVQEGWVKLSLSNIKKVMAFSLYNAYAITNDNKLYVAGTNQRHNVGIRQRSFEYWTHVMDDLVDIINASDASFFIVENGNVYVSGYNDYGQLGLKSGSVAFERTLSIGKDILDPSGC